jgi:hypothetical protein
MKHAPNYTPPSMLLVTKQPTKSGYYWYRADVQHELTIFRVYKEDGEWCCSRDTGRNDDENFVSNYQGEWAGPIPEPVNT